MSLLLPLPADDDDSATMHQLKASICDAHYFWSRLIGQRLSSILHNIGQPLSF
jgi:hypothetical protein